MLKAIALDREFSGDQEGWGIADASAGLRGRIIRSDNTAEIKLFAATFLSGAADALTENEASFTGNLKSGRIFSMPTAKRADSSKGILRKRYPKTKHAKKIDAAHEDAPEYRVNGSDLTMTRLSRVRWNFADANASRRSIHAFHSYPARFIPEIPRTVIRELKPPRNTFVFDPFCGCGTTLVEAQQAGYPSVGVDLNPIGCLLSRVKTTLLPSNFVAAANRCLMEAQQSEPPPLPAIPNLLHWFRRDVCEALAALRLGMRDIRDPATKDALEAVLSSIIVRVSNQESDTRYAAVSKDVSGQTVFGAFAESVQTLASLAVTLPLLAQAPATVINRNVFDIQPADIPGDVGLVITSPPYPNAYEYWLYHKYRMWWLGYDPLAVKSSEIGARAHFFSARRREREDFYTQMAAVFKLLVDVMREGAYCCFIAGDSKIHGRIVDNAELLLKAAARHGFRLVFRSDREINPHRKSFNLHHARIKREHVLVWER